MSSEPVERKLLAIVMADVVGYSRRMGEDESGTLQRFQHCRDAIIAPLIDQANGRVVKFLGDGFLAAFPSVVDALRFAVEMQKAAVALPDQEGRRLAFRVGVNLGDVIAEGDDLFGDGVNVAARLQEIAEPDSVCVSGTAYTQVEGRLTETFEHIGPQRLKNIAKPVDAYLFRVRPADRPSYLGRLPWVDLPAEKPSVITGGCLCRAVRYEVTEPDLGAMYCHCSMCRRSTGGPMVAGITVSRAATRWIGREPTYYRSSKIAERGFCNTCGTSLIYKSLIGEWTKWYLLLIGSLDDPNRFPPLFHLGIESQLSWLDLPDSLQRMSCYDSPTLKAAYNSVGEEVP